MPSLAAIARVKRFDCRDLTLVYLNIPIHKGLEQLLRDRLEDLEDYEEAKQAHEAFIASGEKGIPFEDVFKNVK